MALTENKKVIMEEGVFHEFFAEKEANTGVDYKLYNGSLVNYGTTGGIKKSDDANDTEIFCGMVVEGRAPITVVKSTGGTAELSTTEKVRVRTSGYVTVKTAVGPLNTAKCSAATNGALVYVTDDESVCTIGTSVATLVKVGRQIKYISDNEVIIALNEY